jgi:hypothetical protein
MDDIRHLRAVVAALSAAVAALVDTHPDRGALAKQIAHVAEQAGEQALPYPVSDEEIETTDEILSAYRRIAGRV